MELFYCKVTVSNFNERELHHKCFPITFGSFYASEGITCKTKK